MLHLSHLDRVMRTSGKELGRLAGRAMSGRRSTPSLYPALLIAGGVAAAAFFATYYFRTRGRARGAASEPRAGADDFSQPIVVGGSDASLTSSATPREEDSVPQRTEYFANDTSSTPAPDSFSTDNPDIPTLHPERDGVEAVPQAAPYKI